MFDDVEHLLARDRTAFEQHGHDEFVLAAESGGMHDATHFGAHEAEMLACRDVGEDLLQAGRSLLVGRSRASLLLSPALA